jgi:hypothetical protein
MKHAIDVPPFGELADPPVLAGATWIVTDFGTHPTQAQVREVINAGPG